MKERNPVIPHGKVVEGKHQVVLCFETKRGYRTPTMEELKRRVYEDLRLLDECVPQGRICKGRG